MDMVELKELRKHADLVIEEAKLKKSEISGAINWGDLYCVEVGIAHTDDGETNIYVWIEEADPTNTELHNFIADGIYKLNPDLKQIEIRTEW